MPKVTDKEYQMPDFLIEKMDLVHERITTRKLDAIFLVDGDEGFGKTGISILLAYYVAWKTGREFNLNHMFFDPVELMNYVNSTRKKVIVWDEAALGGLASGWQNKVQQKIIQTLMTCRSRQHIIFFNCPKFYRLNKYFVMDRAEGLIHVYSEDRINAGLCTFYKKQSLEPMLNFWTKKNKHPYKVFYKKHLRGNFIDAFNTKKFKDNIPIINEDKYDTKKDANTQAILTQYGSTQYNTKLLKLQHKVATAFPLQAKQIAEILEVRRGTISEWRKIPIKYPEILRETN